MLNLSKFFFSCTIGYFACQEAVFPFLFKKRTHPAKDTNFRSKSLNGSFRRKSPFPPIFSPSILKTKLLEKPPNFPLKQLTSEEEEGRQKRRRPNNITRP